MGIGARIKVVREAREISREDMAERMDMSLTAYGRLERDEVKITMDRLEAASAILETPIEEFLNHDHLTITMKNKSGANGYHVVQHQAQIPVDKLEHLLSTFTAVLKEQQEMCSKLIGVVEALSQQPRS